MFTELNEEGVPRHPPRLRLKHPRRLEGPSGPKAHWRDLGHLRPIFRKGLLDAYLGWALEEQRNYVVYAGATPHVVVAEPESVLKVFANDRRFLRNPSPTEPLFGRSLLRREGRGWAELRRHMAPAFQPAALDPAVPVIQDECDRLIDQWRGQESVRPTRDLSFALLRVLGRVLFGFEFHPERHGGKPLHRALITLSTSSVLSHLLPRPLVKARLGREIRAARRWVDALCEEVLEHGTDTVFLEAQRKALRDGLMDRELVIDNLRNLLIAGHETSATASAWSMALLAQHPELATKVRREGSVARQAASLDAVAALTESNLWSKETMRLYPPVPISISMAASTNRLGELAVPAGTRVDVCSYVLHRLPWLWPEPERFQPSRFEAKPRPGSYLPYLHGPHTCLGIRLAEAEVPLITARLADAFDFELPEGPPRVNLRLSLNPAGLVIRPLAR